MRAICIRDDTCDALKALERKANANQQDVEVSLSDVIDALLETNDELVSITDTILGIVAVARKN